MVVTSQGRLATMPRNSDSPRLTPPPPPSLLRLHCLCPAGPALLGAFRVTLVLYLVVCPKPASLSANRCRPSTRTVYKAGISNRRILPVVLARHRK